MSYQPTTDQHATDLHVEWADRSLNFSFSFRNVGIWTSIITLKYPKRSGRAVHTSSSRASFKAPIIIAADAMRLDLDRTVFSGAYVDSKLDYPNKSIITLTAFCHAWP